MTSAGKPHVISQRLQFAAINKAGQAVNAGIAPHLNLRPATAEEVGAVRDLLGEDWLTSELEKTAIRFATVDLAQGHVAEVKARRLPEIEKVEQEVRSRLKKEINYWDSRAFELKEEEKAGKKTRLNWQNAQRRAEELAERQKRRMDQLLQERFISSQPPRVRGGMVVIPRGLLDARKTPSVSNQFSEDPAARKEIELAAMRAVMAAERALGHEPVDVSVQKVGYDIASHDPRSGHLRFIEVKGRIDGADSVMITRQEVITSLHEPEKFILAIVSVAGGFAHEPRYVRGALVEREPSFLETAIQFDLRRLLERAEAPL
jgi:Protein NO VEIN, C-terminal